MTLPTKAVSNPVKPSFVPSDFDYIFGVETVASIAGVTAYPTAAPTAAPSRLGHIVVERNVEISLILVALFFPLTVSEASSLMMRTTLESGFAAALGLGAHACTISMVHGKPTGHNGRRAAGVQLESKGGAAGRRLESKGGAAGRRLESKGGAAGVQLESKGGGIGRRLADLEIIFEVQLVLGSDATQLALLKAYIVSAAEEGSIVANIQAAAAINGVFVQALKEMPREISARDLTLSDGVKNATVLESVRVFPTYAPSADPPSFASSLVMEEDGLGVASLVGILCVVMFAVCAGTAAFRNSKGVQKEGQKKNGKAKIVRAVVPTNTPTEVDAGALDRHTKSTALAEVVSLPQGHCTS
jgi:hypothetical protein